MNKKTLSLGFIIAIVFAVTAFPTANSVPTGIADPNMVANGCTCHTDGIMASDVVINLTELPENYNVSQVYTFTLKISGGPEPLDARLPAPLEARRRGAHGAGEYGVPRRRASRGGAPPRPAGARGDLDARGGARRGRPIDGRHARFDVAVAPHRPLRPARLPAARGGQHGRRPGGAQARPRRRAARGQRAAPIARR